MIKNEKKKRREWEDKIDFEEEQRIGLGMRLNEIGKQKDLSSNLQHTQTDLEQYKAESIRLQERIQ